MDEKSFITPVNKACAGQSRFPPESSVHLLYRIRLSLETTASAAHESSPLHFAGMAGEGRILSEGDLLLPLDLNLDSETSNLPVEDSKADSESSKPDSCAAAATIKGLESSAAMAMAAVCVFLVILLLCSVWPFGVATSSNDVAVLQELRQEWQGSRPGGVLDSWSLNEYAADPCASQWRGVVCSSKRTRSVIRLHLSGADLSGGIPSAIGGLAELGILDLSGNPLLVSSIPREIGNLRRLTHLNLAGCNFSGEVPKEIFNLNKLKYLDLSNNPHLSVDLDAQQLVSLLRRREQEPLSYSRRHLRHRRSLLQSSSKSNSSRRNLPIFYTYIALGCVGSVILVILTFCCCRFFSVRRTRNDIFLTTPGAPSPFQLTKPSRAILIANKNPRGMDL